MFAPKLYKVNKIPLKYIMESDYHVKVEREENNLFTVLQQDNMLFRQLRLLTGDNTGIYNPWIIFANCKGCKTKLYDEPLRKLVQEGFEFNNRHYVISERSASMVRQSILSFIDKRFAGALRDAVTMGLDIGKSVLSKWYAYCGLLLSSCHCLEEWKPKIVIIPDKKGIIQNQKIKYVTDIETDFVDKNGNKRKWKQKDIAEGTRDIEINLFDGCGIHHPAITDEISELLGKLGDIGDTRCTSVLIRAPFIKGMSHEVDYVTFFKERDVEFIQDIWGQWHDVRPGSTPMIIMNESMYKGYKYFRRYEDKRDWERYWDMFDKYNHCIGIVKWNYSLVEEEVYRRGNYQIFQDLNLTYEDFRKLAQYTMRWIENIISGDWMYTACFLGLFANHQNPVIPYVKALLKNPEMINEISVRNYLVRTMKKYIDEMKCGKIYIKSCSRFLVPDLIMLMEHVGGLPLSGCLDKNEFWTRDINGSYTGDYLIERNPHICKSEHVLLKATKNRLINEYLTHLSNTCMINCKSLVAQRLNGADTDGDLVLVVDSSIMKSGVDTETSIVIDIDDKITTLEEEDTGENKLNVILRGMHSLIGETSNCATTFHNKTPQTAEQKRKYEKYIDLLSVVNGKAIDSAKTGVIFNIPRNIAKYGKPLPYFMKYAGEFYKTQKKFLRSQSNMNRLCWKIEKWHTSLKWPQRDKDFDYRLMMDVDVGINDSIASAIENIFLDYNRELTVLKKDEKHIQNEYGPFELNWDSFYEKYRSACFAICPNKTMLANIAVFLCYEKYPNKSKGFIWNMAGNEVVDNVQQVKVMLPLHDEVNGDFEYLGKLYRMEEMLE